MCVCVYVCLRVFACVCVCVVDPIGHAVLCSQRLGCLKNGVREIKEHLWFAEINWEALLAKRISPPIIPELSSTTDVSQFDVIDNSGHAKIIPYVSDGSNWDAGF